MPAASAAVLRGAALALAISCFFVLVSPSAAVEKTEITILAVVKHYVLVNRKTKGAVNRFVHTLNDPRWTTLDSGFLQKYHLRAALAFSFKMSPPEILDIVCREVREKRINAIFYMSDLLYEDESSGSTLYLMQIAKFLGLPIVAWFPESSGVIQPTDGSLLLQMSPTIRHQVRAMFSILRRYNWKHFCVVTGETLGRNYFINVLRSLVDSSDGWFNLLAMIQVTPRDTSHLRTQLQEIVSVESRVVLLYASQSEAEAIFEVASSLGLTGAGFVWILSKAAVKASRSSPREYPVGILGIDYDKNNPIKDGLGVWAQAMQNLAMSGELRVRNMTLTPSLSCDSQTNIPWKHGQTVYDFMKNVSLPVTFADDGSAIDTKLKIMNLNNKRHWATIGTWQSKNDEIVMDDISWPGGQPTPPRGRPDRYHLKVVTIEEKPYVTYADPDPKTGTCPGQATLCRIAKLNETMSVANATRDPTLYKCCSGLCIDLLRLLSDKIGFDYELFEVEDEKWGAYDKATGEWNGLVRSLMDGKADISMTSLKITPKRSEMIDFSVPFLETGITIIVAVRDGVISPTAFLEPYDYPSWCLILVFSVHASGAAIFIFEWLSPNGLDRGNRPIREHRFSLFRSFWLIWAMLFGAAVNVDNPRGVSSRFLGNIWALFAVVFTASYTANLAAFMITKEDYDRLTGIQDWRLMNPTAHRPPFKFATVPHGSTETTMMNNYPKMHRYMSPYNKSEVAYGVKAVKDGEINAFIYDATVLEYLAAHDDKCKLRTVGNWYAMTGYGVGFPKGSKWIQQFNKYMLQFQHDGEMERLQKFWLAGACKKKDGGESSMPLGIPNFTSAYILLAAGMLLGALLLLLEHTYFKFFRDSLRKIDRCGCCGLVSLSMGQSLTFERSVMQAIELQRNFKCKNPICETQTWKLKHKLDLALLRIDRLQKQVTGSGLALEGAPPAPSTEAAAIGWRPGLEPTVARSDNERPATGRQPATNSHQCVVDTIPATPYSANSSEPSNPATGRLSYSPLSGSPATTSRDSRSSSPDDAGRRTTGVRVERWPKRRKGHLYTRVNSDEHVMKETVL